MAKKAKTVTVTLKVVIPKGQAISARQGLAAARQNGVAGQGRYRLPLMLNYMNDGPAGLKVVKL